MTYEMRITETLIKVVRYDADSLEEALKMAEHDYLSKKIVLDREDILSYEITEE